MPESGPYGSVRGARSNSRPYRESGWQSVKTALMTRSGSQPNDMYSFAFGRHVRVMTCSVLLDLDGTLIDSQPGILASCRVALRALGHEPDES
jgi:hypothetical protein